MEPIRAIIEQILGESATSIVIINRPPTRSKPQYMRIWEARQADGLEYDPHDEAQQLFLAQINNAPTSTLKSQNDDL